MSVEDIKLSDIQKVYENLKLHPDLFFHTPLLQHVDQQLKIKIPHVKSLSLKLETMQCTGSFKARGVVNQFLSLDDQEDEKRTLVTMSAGNYGKAFVHVAKIFKYPAVVFMPESAPMDRKYMIESYGASVIRCPRNELMNNVNKHQVEHGSLFLHSFDDAVLIKGHASAGLELSEQVSSPPDIVVICCGGGGFLAGTALALKLLGWDNTKIYGVEPEKACTMYAAVKAGKIVPYDVEYTIAAGLAPPFAGEHCFKLIRKHVEEILLVSDEQIQSAVSTLYDIGLVVEPSGAAAFAALLFNKIPNTKDKNIVVFLTGSNVSGTDLLQHINNATKK